MNMYHINFEREKHLVTVVGEGTMKESELQQLIETLAGVIEESSTNTLRIIIDTTETSFTMRQLPYLYKIRRLSQSAGVNKMAILISEKMQRSYKIKLGVQDHEGFAVFIDPKELYAWI